MKVARTVWPGGKGARTGNAEGVLTYRIKRATTPHRTGKLEDGGCAVPNHALHQAKVRYLYEAVILDILFGLDRLLDLPAKWLLKGQDILVFEKDTRSNIVITAKLKDQSLDISVITVYGGSEFVPYPGTIKIEV